MAPPQHQLTSEAAHDLAGALRGLPEALEGLNDRIEQATSKAEVEEKLTEVQHQLEVRQREFEEKQAATRRRTVAVIFVAVILAIAVSIAFVLLVPVANNRDQVERTKATVKILQRATGADAAKAQQDFADLLLARLHCQTQQDLQIEYQAATGKKNLIFDPPACQAVVDALQNKFNSDLVASQAAGSPPTTATTRPKSGPGTKPGSPGPTTPPGTTPTTQPPTPPTTQPSPPPSTPPSTVACVTSPVFDGCVKQPGT